MKTKNKPSFFKKIGPGIITGASDDDPSGIATYTQAGAQFGLATLWTALITFPLMLAIQEMCGRIGLVTSNGLTSILMKHYSKTLLYFIIFLTVPAIIFNIAADIAAIGSVAHLMFAKIPANLYSFFFTVLLILLLTFFSYKKIVKVLKYLCLSILLYLAIPFFSTIDWKLIFKSTFIPTFQFNKEFFNVLIAILGTTISPYLFFWQATMEAEHKKQKNLTMNKTNLNDMQQDITFGMFCSNLVMYFIILTTGTVLFSNGIHRITSVEQAAKALEPLAGAYSYLFFSLGIIGTGFLSIPVLCGSLSYILSTAFGWKAGLNKKYKEAKSFYTILIVSLFLGLCLNFIHFNAMQALFYSAILYGVTTPFLILVILHVANNKKIMGKYVNGTLSNSFGFLVFLLMAFAVLGMIIMQIETYLGWMK